MRETEGAPGMKPGSQHGNLMKRSEWTPWHREQHEQSLREGESMARTRGREQVGDGWKEVQDEAEERARPAAVVCSRGIKL